MDLSQWPIISLPNNRTLAARLLIGADGANSPVRQFANIPSPGWDYPQHGVVATLDLDTTSPENALRTAYQRFLPTGPIALLPLPGNKASLVWSITAKYAGYLKSLPTESLLPLLNAAFRLEPIDLKYHLTNPTSDAEAFASDLAWRESVTSPTSTGLPPSIPRITAIQPNTLASFPLRLRHADTYTSHRVALIGDAAHTLHPLAGQGLNLGLADAESLAKCIVRGVETGMDIGTAWCLDAYNAERWAANNAVLGVCDKLQKVFSVESGPVVWGRGLGFSVLDRLGSVKGAVMRAAAGR
jgi:ubiquinone biosynthesis monooxygenase Coq6